MLQTAPPEVQFVCLQELKLPESRLGEAQRAAAQRGWQVILEGALPGPKGRPQGA